MHNDKVLASLAPPARAVMQALSAFVHSRVIPAEPAYHRQRAALEQAGTPHEIPAIVEELKAEARTMGLWNLFLPALSGLTNVEYARMAELMGTSHELAPEATNCSAPDTGNMELLHMFATPEQKSRYLEPLLDGTVRSAFAMTEPGVASSDATNISTEIRRQGREYVLNGRKWWITGAADPRCEFMIVMGLTDPSAPPHRQQSMVLVPLETPGVAIVRNLSVYGYVDQQSHCEIRLDNVRVPIDNLLGEEGSGFELSQARLGPGRIHHCMRSLGLAERALALLVERARSRTAFGSALIDHERVRAEIAECRIALDQARQYTLHTAALIDLYGAAEARSEIAGIKVAVPRAALKVLDVAVQVHGAAGLCDDFPLARMWTHLRTLRIADGPDEVHLRTLAKHETRRQPPLTPMPELAR